MYFAVWYAQLLLIYCMFEYYRDCAAFVMISFSIKLVAGLC